MSVPAEASKPDGYEFSAAQNVVIHDLAGGLHFVALVLGLSAVAFLGGAIIGFWMSGSPLARVVSGCLVALGLIMAPSARWTRRAALSFDTLVTTQGSDVAHLMTALNELARYYRFLRLLVVIVMALVMLVMGGLMVVLERVGH